ncbi:Protein of uncharacterised function (DUF2541) [Klebsiella pneumoniae subsp. ozaenae]|uniref:Protein of uncharacterized function (DUF2541) n=1 Tax=Klebsiella pneumoniae subsp. ozaenae TaxID=574 RepID=A0A377Z0I3_KLEPO|nr:Protein of uncharacterised function (DUF2541) [Klebsiella pneumoniae subsp. ozaenae]
MKSLYRLSVGLILGVSFITSAAANDHKILGVIAMPRNETNDLTLTLPVCRVVKTHSAQRRPRRCTTLRGDGLL